ncbi:MAG TPA: glycosyltransferase [Bacillota bacterium]|nr:glycosyltransferase [Bacillota bacterium]
MRVLFTNDAPLIKYGLAAGFQQIACDVKIMSGPDQLWGQTATEQEQRLTRVIGDFKPDFIFTEGHPRIEPQVVEEVAKRLSVPHLYWAIEDPVCTDLTLMTYAQGADFIFTTTVECISRYTTLRKKAEVLLFGCNPQFHRNTGIREEYRHDLVLVASNYSSRYTEAQWLVMPLVEAGFDIKIWGIWWDDSARPVNLLRYPQVYGGILPYEELPAVYSSAKIILGMNCDDTSQTQTSMRPYEVLGCGGGVYLGHYTKAQERIFKDTIFQARNTTETIAKVSRILRMAASERREWARRGQQLVYEQHTYKQRALQILKAFRTL